MLNEDSPYISTKSICERFDTNPRNLKRWQEREVNPMPAPVMKPSGHHFLYLKADIERWEEELKNSKH